MLLSYIVIDVESPIVLNNGRCYCHLMISGRCYCQVVEWLEPHLSHVWQML